MPNTKAKTTKAAPAPKAVHAHVGTVDASRYLGLSGYLNNNRKTAIKRDAYPRNVADLTGRTLGCFHAMRDAYADKPFPARGFDNAICAMLLTSGLLARKRGTGADTVCTKTGYATEIDGDKPLLVYVTAAGMRYGNADTDTSADTSADAS